VSEWKNMKYIIDHCPERRLGRFMTDLAYNRPRRGRPRGEAVSAMERQSQEPPVAPAPRRDDVFRSRPSLPSR
jgi:hypothetical protein